MPIIGSFRPPVLAYNVPDNHEESASVNTSLPCGPCETRESYRQGIALFEAGMMHALDKHVRDLSPDSAALLLAGARHYLRKVVRDIFSASLPEGHQCMTREEMIDRIHRADEVANAALDEVVVTAMERLINGGEGTQRTPVVPQIVRKADGGYNLVRRVPPIEHLALQGGGFKVVGMGGALLALADAGALDHLRAVAGSSAGALIATWLSVGRGIDELKEVLSGELRELLKTDDTQNDIYPDISFQATAKVAATLLWPFGATHDTAIGIIRKLDEITAHEAWSFLKSLNAETLRSEVTALVQQKRKAGGRPSNEDHNAVREDVRLTLTRLSMLAAKPDFSRSRAGRMVTFADMALLHSLAPDRFRHLSISAHDTTTGKNIIFDRHTSPGLPIAYAARASMAHPLIASGVSFPHFLGRATQHVFSDGGISSNIPVEAFVPLSRERSLSDPTAIRPPIEQRLRAASAVMAFDRDGETSAILHGPPESNASNSLFQRMSNSISSAFAGWVATNPGIADDNAADRNKLWEFGANVISVKHGDLSTMDMDANAERKRDAFESAHADVLAQLKIARGDLYAVEVSSVEEAFALLDDDEKALLRAHSDEQGIGDSEDRSVEAQRQLCELAWKEEIRRNLEQASARDAELEEAIAPLFLRA